MEHLTLLLTFAATTCELATCQHLLIDCSTQDSGLAREKYDSDDCVLARTGVKSRRDASAIFRSKLPVPSDYPRALIFVLSAHLANVECRGFHQYQLTLALKRSLRTGGVDCMLSPRSYSLRI